MLTESDEIEAADFAVCALCDCGDCDLFFGFWDDPTFTFTGED